MAESKKTPRTDQLRQALANRPKPAPKPHAPVAAAATPKPKKANPRSAKARDERANVRGRLPICTFSSQHWDGENYTGVLVVNEPPPGVEAFGDIVNDKEWDQATKPRRVKAFHHKADGLFRLMEELDIMFWEWYAKESTSEERKRLKFAQNPPAPAPFPRPSTSGGTEDTARTEEVQRP